MIQFTVFCETGWSPSLHNGLNSRAAKNRLHYTLVNSRLTNSMFVRRYRLLLQSVLEWYCMRLMLMNISHSSLVVQIIHCRVRNAHPIRLHRANHSTETAVLKVLPTSCSPLKIVISLPWPCWISQQPSKQ